MSVGKRSTLGDAVIALGLPSPRALHRLIESGAPGPSPGKRGSQRYDVAAIAEWRKQRDERRRRPDTQLTVERIKDLKLGRQLKSLELRERRGQLISSKDAEAVLQTMVGAVRAEFLSLSRRAVLAGLPREYEPVVRKLIVEALRELFERGMVVILTDNMLG